MFVILGKLSIYSVEYAEAKLIVLAITCEYQALQLYCTILELSSVVHRPIKFYV